MFKAYASTVDNENEEKKSNITLTKDENNANTWLENKSFSIEPPPVVRPPPPPQQQQQQSKPVKEEKKPVQHISVTKKPSESNSEIFYIDRRRDRANLTVQYTRGVPRYGTKFCNQHPLGSRISKSFRKQRISRYFHQKFDEFDTQIADKPFVKIDDYLEQLNRTIREQPHSFDAWQELINYQFYLYKTNNEQTKLTALYSKQLSIIDRALEFNSNRLQFRLLQLNLRCQSHLFNSEYLLNEWQKLIKDCLKSSDDRTINETWLSYMKFHLNHIELFSIEKFNDIIQEFLSTYNYHMQTKSEKERLFLKNHILDILHIWTCTLKEAGYIERGLSIYQALIELNLDIDEKNFQRKLEHFQDNWNTDKCRFGEEIYSGNLIDYLNNEFECLSKQENHLFNQTYQSWILIEQLRMKFYQTKLINQSIHIHRKLFDSLNDTSQIDNEIFNLSFEKHIRPFIYQFNDKKQFYQLIIYYLHFLNGLPNLSILQEILNQLNISLNHSFQEQLLLDDEFQQLYSLFSTNINQQIEDDRFSFEYISKIYERLLTLPILQSQQIEFILLYWYYLAENIRQLKQQQSKT